MILNGIYTTSLLLIINNESKKFSQVHELIENSSRKKTSDMLTMCPQSLIFFPTEEIILKK